jgi:protein-S-isoprenylcysteine O-methyltransferase Ste14
LDLAMTREQRLIFWTVIRVAAVVLFTAWFVLHLRRWDHRFFLVLPFWLRFCLKWLGAVLIVAGGLVVLLCAASLATRGILEQPGDRLTPSSLVVSGPFQYSRNPMSLAVVVFFLGLGLFCLSPSVLMFSGLLFLVLHLVVVYVEEPKLRNRFGQTYQEYMQHTARWLPSMRERT